LNKISTVILVCPKFLYFVFTPHGNYIIWVPKLVFEFQVVLMKE
jgi:hypothetical protein